MNRMDPQQPKTQQQVWDDLAEMVLPKVIASTPERMEEMKRDRTHQALHLASAALRAAGEFTLADNLLNLRF